MFRVPALFLRNMKKVLSLFFLAIFAVFPAVAQWIPDILGDGYEMRYVSQPDDYSGKVRSTIVRKLSRCGGRRGVLYVHGFNDYFFQKEMGDRFVDSCYNFYAVDLRKYGRSLIEGQKAFQVRDMHEYFADIDSAVMCMKCDGIDEIVLMGHSTGGLTTSLYMNENPPAEIKALVLNSPFLDWNQSKFQERILIPVVDCIGGLLPGIGISQGDSRAYSESLLKKYGGEWDYDTSLKYEVSPDVDTGWIRAIDQAQAIIQNDPFIKVPVLLMHSDRTAKAGDAPEVYSVSDAVLDVGDISRYGRRLGPLVTEITVKGGLHDLVLSKSEVRNALYDYMFRWLSALNL